MLYWETYCFWILVTGIHLHYQKWRVSQCPWEVFGTWVTWLDLSQIRVADKNFLICWPIRSTPLLGLQLTILCCRHCMTLHVLYCACTFKHLSSDDMPLHPLLCCLKHLFITPLIWVVPPLCYNHFSAIVLTVVQIAYPLQSDWHRLCQWQSLFFFSVLAGFLFLVEL